MATYTDNGTNTPNGSHKVFTYTFPALQTEDIKVALNGIVQATTKYTASLSPAQIEFNNTSIDSSVQESTGAPKTGVQVRVFRETTVGKNSGDEDPKAVFAAGSSIRAADLNANQEQALFAIHELQTQPVKTSDIEPDAITGDKIADDQINSEHYVDGSIDHVHLANDIIDGDNIQDDVINSEHYVAGSIDEEHIANSAVTSNKIADNAVTTTEILNGAVTRDKIANDAIDGTKLADNAVNSEHYTDGSISRVHLADNLISGDQIQDSVINSEHYVDGSIDHVHLANDIIDGDNIQDDVINSEHIAAGALDNEHYAAGSITSDKLNGATVVTNSEQAASTPNDTSFFTTAAAEARYFNASTGETIKDGQTFPDNDTTIATTAAINDRIIDLVDDVGGFVPIANETSFPTSNPDVNDGDGTIVSVSAASTNLVPSGTTVTIANGRGSGLPVVITGVSATIPSGFGFLVETTSTDHTYAFHRLVPKATEVTTVAGKATEIGRLGTAAAVEDLSILGTADVVADLNTLGTADVVADMNMLATSDVISDMNTLAVTSVINDMDTVAGISSNVTTVANIASDVTAVAADASDIGTVAADGTDIGLVAGSIGAVNTTATNIASVNTTANNITNVNNFADRYQIAANNPSTDGGGNALVAGDLYFNTSANELKVYNGSAWQGGVTATGNFAVTTGNTFSGDNLYSDGVKGIFGNSNDLQVYHDGTNSYLMNNTGTLRVRGNDIRLQDINGKTYIKNLTNGAVFLAYDNATKLETTSTGVTVTGQVVADNVKLPDSGAIRLGGNASALGDLRIYHDGSNSYIKDAGAGDLFITHGNDAGIISRTNGGVELYYDGSKVAETTTNGFQVINGKLDIFNTSGGASIRNMSASGAFFLGNAANADLALYVQDNTSNSIILQVNTGEKMLECTAGGSTDLYHHGSKKLYTTSTGAYIENRLDIGGANLGWSYPKPLNVQGSSGAIVALRNWDTTTYAADTNASIDFSLRTGNTGNQSGSCEIRAFKENGTNGNNARGLAFYTGANGGQPVKRINITSDGNLQIPADNTPLQIGVGQDLQIYHDGTDSYLQNGTGDLYIQTTGSGDDIFLSAIDDVQINAAGKTGIKVIGDAEVELYYNGARTLETFSNALHLYGNQYECNIDLKLDSGVRCGFLGFTNSGRVQVNGAAGGNSYETYLEGNLNGSTKLYWDHTPKLETTSIGATIDGGSNVSMDSSGNGQLKVNGNGYSGAIALDGTAMNIYHNSSSRGIKFGINESEKVNIDTSGHLNIPNDSGRLRLGASADLQIYHDGNNSYIKEDGTGNLYIYSANLRIENADGSKSYIEANDGGAVELYHNNNKKLETMADGVIIQDLENNTVQLRLDTTQGTGGSLYADTANSRYGLLTTDGEWSVKAFRNGATELHQDNARKFTTTASGCDIMGRSVDCQLNFNNSSNTTRFGGIYGYTESGTDLMAFLKSDGNYSLVVYDTGLVKTYGTIRPHANDSYDLGTSSHKWNDVFATSFHGDGSNLTGVSGGKVLQVIHGTLNGTFSTSNSGYTGTGCSVNITMSDSNNKVLVMAGGTVNNSSAGCGVFTTIYRTTSGTSTNISQHGNHMAGYWQEDNSNNVEQSQFLHTLDTPGSGTHTYQVFIYAHAGNGTAYWGYRNTGVITVMEIEA